MTVRNFRNCDEVIELNSDVDDFGQVEFLNLYEWNCPRSCVWKNSY